MHQSTSELKKEYPDMQSDSAAVIGQRSARLKQNMQSKCSSYPEISSTTHASQRFSIAERSTARHSVRAGQRQAATRPRIHAQVQTLHVKCSFDQGFATRCVAMFVAVSTARYKLHMPARIFIGATHSLSPPSSILHPPPPPPPPPFRHHSAALEVKLVALRQSAKISQTHAREP
ncbi:hypothetical protein EJ05DRAFT_538540 [Pseudovirgaria hyperparasitica]|uniref:Uncharacterized protein n=1 Tax=Pseudovirgaria hyperparasitica TaxID=470096 RepID=A0A6A6W559_9PEZI|nr:uncharacterized protein EJ05DRAFT_538540 [Pseudovirgaria hyperparasitica]KAF2757309.1 hypothetical protein EJ05DRAFT_538540 [Pseudovirgaria hyperparasitica]